jgi:predicted Zn-ribbon and HTH transcriptional regulator
MTFKEFLQKLFGYTSKKLKCDNCGYEWTAVYPIIREAYQTCPKCKSKKWRERK